MEQEYTDIKKLEEEIFKKHEEISALRKKISSARNHTLNQLSEKIFDKIVQDKLYHCDDPVKGYFRINGNAENVPEGVILKSYECYDGYDMEEVEDPNMDDADILSITFNIKIDNELRDILGGYDWKNLT